MRPTLAIVTALTWLIARPATAQTFHGPIGGLQLLYRHSDKTVLPANGAAYIDGVLVELDQKWGTGAAWNPPCNLYPNTWYYTYIVNAVAAIPGSPFLPNNYSWVCSPVVPPISDGHPQGSVTGKEPFGNVQVNSPHAVFIGSFRTDAKSAVVPFYRNGDEVTLMTSVGFDVTPLQWTNGGVTVQSTSPLFLPFSASAAILDLRIQNADGLPHWVSFLDPNDHVVHAPSPSKKSVQLELAFDSLQVAGIAGIQTQRAVLNYDLNNVLWAYSDTTLIAPGLDIINIYPQLRGYVEALHGLTPGCLGAGNVNSGTIDMPCCHPPAAGNVCATALAGTVCLQNADCLSGACCNGGESLLAACTGLPLGTCK